MEAETETKIESDKLGKVSHRKTLFLVVCLILIVFLGYESYLFYQKKAFLKTRLDTKTYSLTDNDFISESYLNGNPKPAQDAFLNDLANGVNDKFTKTDAYFITHRYFDNDGNVYEIYDYVNSHQSLEFLKEAEQIYPGIFDQIKAHTLKPTFSTEAMYAVLAYIEVLDSHGYADLAAQSTAANQYAKIAYFTKKGAERNPGGPDVSFLIANNTRKALFFAVKAKDSMAKLSESAGLDLLALKKPIPTTLKLRAVGDATGRSVLVGLNQYAATLRYLEATGTDISALDKPVNAKDIFALTQAISKQYFPMLKDFTALLDASTLSLVSPQSTNEIKAALQPILEFDLTKREPVGIILKIIDARNVKTMDLDIYGRINIVTLANIDPEFKAWLISGGWQESDFKL